MTTQAATMMITSTTGISSSTACYQRKRYRRRIPQWWILCVAVSPRH